jgi:hypothetical protein
MEDGGLKLEMSLRARFEKHAKRRKDAQKRAISGVLREKATGGWFQKKNA